MQVLLHLGKQGSQCSDTYSRIQGFAITLHTKLRKQAFLSPLPDPDLVPPEASAWHAVRNQGCQCIAGRLHVYLLHPHSGTRCFLPFPLTFPAISPATETGPPNSSLHSFSSLTVIHRLSDICGGYSNLLIDGKTNHY